MDVSGPNVFQDAIYNFIMGLVDQLNTETEVMVSITSFSNTHTSVLDSQLQFFENSEFNQFIENMGKIFRNLINFFLNFLFRMDWIHFLYNQCTFSGTSSYECRRHD